jgi:hypothetical protein
MILSPLKAAMLALAAAIIGSAGCGHESAASPTITTPAAIAPVVTDAPPAPQPETATASAPAESPAETPATEPTERPQALESTARVESSTPTERPAGQRPPADRGPTRPGDAEKISFDDLNLGMPADVVYRPFMLSDRVKELDGKRVSIMGYMHGGAGAGSTRNIKEFILLKNTECKYGPKGQADHLAAVFMRKDKTIDFQAKAVKIEGTLAIEPFTGEDGNTWRIFRLDDAVVK